MLALIEHRIRYSSDTPHLRKKAEENAIVSRFREGKFREIHLAGERPVEMQDGYAIVGGLSPELIDLKTERRWFLSSSLPVNSFSLCQNGVLSFSKDDDEIYIRTAEKGPFQDEGDDHVALFNESAILRRSDKGFTIEFGNHKPLDVEPGKAIDAGSFWMLVSCKQIIIIDLVRKKISYFPFWLETIKDYAFHGRKVAVIIGNPSGRRFIRVFDAFTGERSFEKSDLSDNFDPTYLTLKGKRIAWLNKGRLNICDGKNLLSCDSAGDYALLDKHCLVKTDKGLEVRYFDRWSQPRLIPIKGEWNLVYPYLIFKNLIRDYACAVAEPFEKPKMIQEVNGRVIVTEDNASTH